MRFAVWRSAGPGISQRECSELCDRVVEQFALDAAATHEDACHRVAEVMSEHLGAGVELRFTSMPSARLSGATARRADGSYVIYCAKSRSWYHRLGILLHEFAHHLLGHEPVELSVGERLRHFAPNLPERVLRLVAERTTLVTEEERQAEEFADKVLERLTEQRQEQAMLASFAMRPHVMRVAEGLAPDVLRRSGADSH